MSSLGAARGEGDTVVYTNLSHNQYLVTFNHKTRAMVTLRIAIVCVHYGTWWGRELSVAGGWWSPVSGVRCPVTTISTKTPPVISASQHCKSDQQTRSSAAFWEIPKTSKNWTRNLNLLLFQESDKFWALGMLECKYLEARKQQIIEL